MNWPDTIIVAAILLAASAYLVKTFWPKSKKGGCGCGSADCKIPKPKFD